jgi:Lon protease-like protein
VSELEIPLFPLPVVLFPGGRLPLRIFEPRYLDMVRECGLSGGCFGVCLINNRQDTARPATHFSVGTTARIIDFSSLDGGLLGIVVRGEQRFIIRSTRMRNNGLLMAGVNLLTEATPVEVPEDYSVLSLIAARMMEQIGAHYPSFQPSDLQDASWLGYRLSELLPLENTERQSLLQLTDPLQRLQTLLALLPRFQEPDGG